MTILLGVLAATGFGIEDLLNVGITRAASIVRVLLWMLGASVVPMLVVAALVDGMPHGHQWAAVVGTAALGGAAYLGGLGALLLGLRRVAICGLLDAVALVAGVVALVHGPIAVASVLIGQFATLAVLLGVVVLHERPARHQVAGIVITLLSISVMSATR